METLVALLVAAIVFGGLTGVLLTALKSSALGRQNQQAADFLTRALEDARTLDFAALGHVASDVTVAGDSRLQATCAAGTLCINPGNGLAAEPLHVIASGAGITQHLKTVSVTEGNRTNFKVGTYVSEIAGQDSAETLRLTAYVTWGPSAQVHVRSSSTVVTLAQRGLPVPVFSFTANGGLTTTKAPGARVLYSFTLTNQGAPDRWNITMSGTGASKGWYFAKDVNGNGTYEPATDTLLTTSDADSTVDSGRLDPNESEIIFMVWDTTTSEAAATWPTTVRVTSSLQSDASVRGNLASATDTYKELATSTVITGSSGGTPPSPAPSPTVTPTASPPAAVEQPACAASASTAVGVPAPPSKGTGYTATIFGLHNGTSGAASGATSTQSSNLFSEIGALNGSTLYAYSNDVNAYGGRTVASAAATTASTLLALTGSTQFSEWRYSLPAKSDLAGSPAVLHLWVAAPAPGTALSSATLNVDVFTQSGASSRVSLGFSQVAVSSSCTGFQEVYVPVTVPETLSVAKGDVLGVRLGSSAGAVRVAYDSTTYPATFGIGVR